MISFTSGPLELGSLLSSNFPDFATYLEMWGQSLKADSSVKFQEAMQLEAIKKLESLLY